MKADPSKPDLPIRPDRVVELIDAYGADPLRWPDAERSAAEQALWNSPQLRQHQASARELDQAIDALPLVAPAPALRERLLRAAPVVRRGPWQWLRALLGELGAPPSVLGPALAAACVLGIAIGSLAPVDNTALAADGAEEDVLALAQFDEPYLLQALDDELDDELELDTLP